MAIGYLDDSKLTNIANAIRSKTGSTSTMTVDQMPANISKIPSYTREKRVCYRDYDGTLIYSYDATEIQNLTSEPLPPDHSNDDVPLTFQDWTWPLGIVKQIAAQNPQGYIDIGPNYVTTDGKTHVYFMTVEDSGSDNYNAGFMPSVVTEGTISWGDGTTDTISSTGWVFHKYTQAGIHHCIIDCDARSIQFGIDDYNSAYIKACSSTYKIFFGSKITWLTDFQIDYCSNLVAMTMPSSVTWAGNFGSTFANCPNLKAFVTPQNFNYDRSSAFEKDSSLEHIMISHLAVLSGSYTFAHCSALKSVAAVNGTFGSFAFAKCNSLISVIGSLQNETATFQDCYALQYISKVPGGSWFSLQNCYALREIEYPEGTTALPTLALYYCRSLVKVTIPSTVTSIGINALLTGPSLTDIIVKATTPPTLSNGISSVGLRHIYVPYSADHSVLAAYQGANRWSDYSSYITELPE